MKKIIFLFCVCFFSAVTFAATKSENIAINVDFYFQQHNKNGHVIQYFIKNNMNLSSANHEWNVVQSDQLSSGSNRFILLGKLDEANSKRLVMSFLVVDNSKTPSILSKPKIIVSYNEKGEIAFGNKNEKIRLTILAHNLKA